MPIADQVGMEIAVNMLFNSLTSKPHVDGQAFIQFDLMHCPRATLTSAWESSPTGIEKGSTFSLGLHEGHSDDMSDIRHVESTRWGIYFGFITRMGRLVKNGR